MIFSAFKCCYCGFFNKSRQQRPAAPKLTEQIYRQQSIGSDTEIKAIHTNKSSGDGETEDIKTESSNGIATDS